MCDKAESTVLVYMSLFRFATVYTPNVAKSSLAMSPKLAERGPLCYWIARSRFLRQVPLRRLHYRFEQSSAGEFAVARAISKITRRLAVKRHRRGYNKGHAPQLAQCPPFFLSKALCASHVLVPFHRAVFLCQQSLDRLSAMTRANDGWPSPLSRIIRIQNITACSITIQTSA